jgi:Cu-Zn family superoxide dismutase
MRVVAALVLLAAVANAATLTQGFARFYTLNASPVTLGYLVYTQTGTAITADGQLTGLTANTPYTMWAHAYGDLGSDDGTTAGTCFGGTAPMMTFTTDAAGSYVFSASPITGTLSLRGSATDGLIGRSVLLHGGTQTTCAGTLFAQANVGLHGALAGDTNDATMTLSTPMTLHGRLYVNSAGTGGTSKGEVWLTPVPTGVSRNAVDGTPATVLYYAALTGVPGGAVPHAMHIHLNSNTTGLNDLVSTGLHYNPTGSLHAFPTNASYHHVGDLGNTNFDANGAGIFDLALSQIGIGAGHNVIGRPVVLHQRRDDGITQQVGDAGGRWAFAVLGITNRRAPNDNFAVSSSTGPDLGAASHVGGTEVAFLLAAALLAKFLRE